MKKINSVLDSIVIIYQKQKRKKPLKLKLMAYSNEKTHGKNFPAQKKQPDGLYFLPKIDTSLLINNPFVMGDFSILLHQLPIKGQYTIHYNKEGEEIKLPVYVDIEVDRKTFIYKSKEKNEMVWGLPRNSEMLWHWIERNIGNNEDYIIINVGRYMRDRRLSNIKTYKDAVKGLIRSGFISITEFKNDEVYWVNPALCYDGNRAKKYATKTKYKRDEKDIQE